MRIIATQEEIYSIRKNCYAECEKCLLKDLEECPVEADNILIDSEN